MKTIGERIRQLREGKDISLRELAKTVKVSAAFLSDVELGRRYPSDKHLDALAEGLNILVDELKAYDTRPPMRELRRMAQADPQYGFAFRQLIDHDISPQDLINFINEQRKGNGAGSEENE